MNLNPQRIPKGLLVLLPMAEKWGISDDWDRDQALAQASKSELEQVARALDDVPDDELMNWLTGPEGDNPDLPAEYIAVTCLTMAVAEAKIKLKRMAC